MPDISALLKSEITRLARKVNRQEMSGLQSASANYRKQISGLKARVQELERAVSKLQKAAGKAEAASKPDPDAKSYRFVAKGFVSLRKRLGLSAEDMGKLIGVSSQTVYNWEQGRAKPRASQLPAISSIRDIGKKEAARRLEQTQ